MGKVSRVIVVTALLAVASFGIAACGDSGSDDSSTPAKTTASAKVTPTPKIAKAGQIVFCTDPTGGPPASYVTPTGEYAGSDIEIAKRVAAIQGVDAKIQTISFNNIVPLLDSGACDAYIGGINDTPERQKIENFADYGQMGEVFLVPKGNPKHITGFDSLSGLTASVSLGTVDQGFLVKQNKAFKAQGKTPMTIRVFASSASTIEAVGTGQADVTVAGYTSLLSALDRFPDKFELAPGDQVNTLPLGIASKKSDVPLQDSFKQAIAEMYKDGSMLAIVKKFKIEKTMFNEPPTS